MATPIEYGLIAALIGVAIIGSVTTLGANTTAVASAERSLYLRVKQSQTDCFIENSATAVDLETYKACLLLRTQVAYDKYVAE